MTINNVLDVFIPAAWRRNIKTVRHLGREHLLCDIAIHYTLWMVLLCTYSRQVPYLLCVTAVCYNLINCILLHIIR